MKLVAHVLNGGQLEVKAQGLEHIPSHGPVLLVARHYHHLFDGVGLYQILPRELHILVTLDWASNRLVRRFMESTIRLARWPLVLRADAITPRSDGTRPQKHSVFTEKDVARYQRRALRDALDLLAEGRVLLIFPEAYPNIDPNFTPKKSLDVFLPFNGGFAVIAAAAEKRLRTPIPIIPVGLNYRVAKRWLAQVNFGSALYAGNFSTRKDLICAAEQEVQRLSSAPG
jgi:1-acyl-sn-glycerol-3-phosphate acyltransferase